VKNMMKQLVSTAVLAGTCLLIGASSTSAAPASPNKGTGCFVGDANGAYYFDAACKAHDNLKLDGDGNLQFYHYQDKGQLPDGAALPSSAIRNTYPACFNFSFGVTCGTVEEVITPSGAYSSSFTAD
jgi:hypothetical protein